jgi:hypothetical protein
VEVCIFIESRLNTTFVFSVVEDSLAQVASRLIDPHILLGLFVSPTSPTNKWVDLENVVNLDNYPVLRLIRFIVFTVPDREVVANSLIPRWFSMFPLLDPIKFVNGPDDVGYDTEISLLRRIVQESPGIRTAWIGETRRVSDWLSSEA